MVIISIIDFSYEIRGLGQRRPSIPNGEPRVSPIDAERWQPRPAVRVPRSRHQRRCHPLRAAALTAGAARRGRWLSRRHMSSCSALLHYLSSSAASTKRRWPPSPASAKFSCVRRRAALMTALATRGKDTLVGDIRVASQNYYDPCRLP